MKIESFGAKSNFQKITGFNDTETKVVSVLDFSDVKFENKMFNEKGSVDKFSAPYNAAAYTLNVISPSQLKIESEEYFKKGADGVWMPVENAIDAGVYYGKFTVSRLNNEYILEQTFTIERIGTEIKIKDASVTYDANTAKTSLKKCKRSMTRSITTRRLTAWSSAQTTSFTNIPLTKISRRFSAVLPSVRVAAYATSA